jgi:3-methyladenine DNA glycosylase AlkD
MRAEMTSVDRQVRDVVAWLKRTGTKKSRHGMKRFGLPSEHAFGVPVGRLQARARQIGRNHELAQAVWESGSFEARLLAAYIGEPERLTSAAMDRWCRDFDNWGVVDTVCFVLFDKSPLAWKKVESWARRRGEFEKRAAFALLASLSLHDKTATDARFLRLLPLIERAATDERNFVKKGVSWALRATGRRSPALRVAAVELATRLAASTDPTARWLGRDGLRDLRK